MDKSLINSRFLQAVAYLLDNRIVESKAKLAEVFGITASKFSEILKSRMLAGTDLIATLCANYGISSEWLLLGDGDMIKGNNGEVQMTNTEVGHKENNEVLMERLRSLEIRIKEKDNQLKEKDTQIRKLLDILTSGSK